MAKDAAWALDLFAVRTAKGVWLQALVVIDVYTRELLDLHVHDSWDVDSVWTIRTFNEVCARESANPRPSFTTTARTSPASSSGSSGCSRSRASSRPSTCPR